MNSEALAETASAAKGHVVPFGKYLLLQRVSVGGMAEVFKALPEGATRVDQIVAIKRILPSIAEDGEFIGMFVDEARLAGQLNHPNICRIYELGRVGDDHYIAMQFLWGRDLLKVMNRFKKAGQHIPPSIAAFIASKACAALHYAHTKRDAAGRPLHIIHRDVSPQNIIVGYSGQVKLIDFGVARAASHSQKTQAGILKGKFGYMSPEMIRGLPIDHRSDVFAMGICLHEALTGTRLFYGETDFATLELVRDAVVAPPSRTTPGVPAALDAIVLRALSRDADDRYASADELRTALQGFVQAQQFGFGEADVGAVMRQAFDYEVTREKQRLQVFSDMLHQGTLKRGAELPMAPIGEGGQGARERGSVEQGGQPATLHSQQPDERALPGSAEPDLHDEKTQIYFSADDVDDPRESNLTAPAPLNGLDAAPHHSTISDVILLSGTRSAAHGAATSEPARRDERPVLASGTYQRLAATRGRVDQRGIATMSIPPLVADNVPLDGSPAHGSRTPWSLVVAAALGLLLAGYLTAHLLRVRTATLEIAAVGDPRAVVRVDGVVRGNPPLRVQDLQPGIHEIEVVAKGYSIARRKLYVEAGRITPVSLVLERDMPKPRQMTVAPVVDTRPLLPMLEAAPAPEVPAPQAPAASARTERDLRRKDRTELSRAQGSGATPAEPLELVTAEETEAQDALHAEGELLISTLPWSRVLIDGVDTGRDTPVRALKVEAGTHRLGLRTPDGIVHNVDIYVEPGQVVRIIRRF